MFFVSGSFVSPPCPRPKTEIGNLASPSAFSNLFSPFSKAHKSSQSQDSTLATRQLPHEVAHHTLRQFSGGWQQMSALDANLDKMWTLIPFHSIFMPLRLKFDLRAMPLAYGRFHWTLRDVHSFKDFPGQLPDFYASTGQDGGLRSPRLQPLSWSCHHSLPQ
jgi:hypothetical protein